MRNILNFILIISTVLLLTCSIPQAQAEPTTQVKVVKYDLEGAVLAETTVDYRWMEENLPVQGDGIIHYYHQGPVFEGNKWDPNETVNFKDKGAVKGTALQNLCDLVGGMAPGDEVMIHAVDGYHLEFGYQNVYQPEPRQGPIVLCWYCGQDGEGSGEMQGEGYPSYYYAGMRTVFFADNSTNTQGKHVFGNWDMHECLPEKSHHFYDLYPSTNGFSVKWVDEIRVYVGGYAGGEEVPAKSASSDTSKETPGPGAMLALVGLSLAAAHACKRGG
jgi:hypothetical protein